MTRASVLVLGACALTIAVQARATLVRGERVSITTAGTTFRLVSSVGSDRGSAVRIEETEILCGRRGCLVLQLFGRSSGAWTVISGTAAYTEWRGRGEFNSGSFEGLLVEAV
jgi:hypothetical protein